MLHAETLLLGPNRFGIYGAHYTAHTHTRFETGAGAEVGVVCLLSGTAKKLLLLCFRMSAAGAVNEFEF